jgi:molybdate transport system ATP-binding protein
MSRLTFDARRTMGDFQLDASFTAEAGRVTVLFGRSGAGKSTIVNMIAGLVTPQAGRIAYGERALFDADKRVDLPSEKRRVGYVFQDARLFPHLSVRRNLLYGRRFAPQVRRATSLEQVATLLGLETLMERRPATLSGGERHRVAIGRALLAEPELLLLDEPLASLDAPRKNEILDHIERLKEATPAPIIYVSHAVDEVIRLADQVVLVGDGRVQASGPPAEIMGRPDLDPFVGQGAGGALIEATLRGHDEAFALSELVFPGGTLHVPRLDLAPGAPIRVRIRARDVALATVLPEAVSMLNILSGSVVSLSPPRGAAVDVVIDVGVPLRAQITARSASELGLARGVAVHALIKTVAVEGHAHSQPT